jgi:hypothetical protein
VVVVVKMVVPVAIVVVLEAATMIATLPDTTGKADGREGEKSDQQDFLHKHTPMVWGSLFNKRL